nr:hypothetical protein [uncultured Rhodopila sp.]
MKRVMRLVFQYLHDINRGIDVTDEERFKSILEEAYRSTSSNFFSYTVSVDRSVCMTTNNADRGGVILSDNAQARDISISQSWNTLSVELPQLADELAKLRIAMKAYADDSDPAHDIATGQIATAEHAARVGDRQGTAAALKAAGAWALKIAEEIGVGVAVASIKGAIGLSPS